RFRRAHKEAIADHPFRSIMFPWANYLTMAFLVCVLIGMYFNEVKRLSLAREIARGITHNEFTVHYQPVFNVKHGSCGGVEALMR
ncbi:hypothetical protein ONK27_27670, partial [Salmonella enterica subsp. enterica serovar Virginia]|nr:hypothetical protein [Salmonella enterica subsp. enterica serovar Virginia]